VPRAQLWGFDRRRATSEVSREGQSSGEDENADKTGARRLCTVPEICAITGHSHEDANRILQAHYLHRDPQIAWNAIRKLEAYQVRLALIDHSIYLDFDSAIPRFESWRPSQLISFKKMRSAGENRVCVLQCVLQFTRRRIPKNRGDTSPVGSTGWREFRNAVRPGCEEAVSRSQSSEYRHGLATMPPLGCQQFYRRP
jgi:hypothetical protein